MSRRTSPTGLLAGALLVLSGTASAQCRLWSGAFSGPQALDDSVFALATFDDGTGRALYAGGRFTQSAGGAALSHIARWNGTSWSPVGGGIAGPQGTAVTKLFEHDDGSGPALYAGGYFTSAGGVPAVGFARWNGSTWSTIGNLSANGTVQSFAIWDDGTGPALFVGGAFSSIGGVPANNIAKWNGATWSTLGAGTAGGGLGWGPDVHALAVYDDGSGPALFAGGGFTSPASQIAKWNGSSWSPVGGGTSGVGGVYALAAFDDGSGPALFVGGNIGSTGLKRWNGTTFTDIPVGSATYALETFDDGSGPALYVGHYGMGGPRRWTGSWSSLGSGTNEAVYALEPLGSTLFAGGLFTRAGGMPSDRVAAWEPCASGTFSPFCLGDGTGGGWICPCGNHVGSPGHGCGNSAGTGGGLLGASGSTAPDTLVLSVTGLTPNAFCLFFQASAMTPAAVFGDGVRCAGGNLVRLYTRQASGGAASAPGAGDVSISARSAAAGDPLGPLSTRVYQVYYRDPTVFGCAATFNITNGLRITW
jgi:hypothetical protein